MDKIFKLQPTAPSIPGASTTSVRGPHYGVAQLKCRLILCCKAAVLTLAGDAAGAQDLLGRLGSAEKDRHAAGRYSYYCLIRDFEKAAEWAEIAHSQRDGTVPFVLQFSFCRGLRANPYWPTLAKMMNLPETSLA
ncbi:MAG: hypothetical protein LAO55_28455 [Acidobacteriia bacterium]|nr:hypothetical protein [Terriglobia bacterium]